MTEGGSPSNRLPRVFASSEGSPETPPGGFIDGDINKHSVAGGGGVITWRFNGKHWVYVTDSIQTYDRT